MTPNPDPIVENNRRKRSWRVWLLSGGLSISGIIFLLSRVDGEAVAAALRMADTGAFALSLLLATGVQFIAPWRWRVMLHNRISRRYSTSATFIGNFISAVVPLRAGEVVRAALAQKNAGISIAESVMTILVSNLLDLVALVVLGLALLLVAPLPANLLNALLIIGAVVGLGTAGLVLASLLLPGMDRSLRLRLQPLLGERTFAVFVSAARPIRDSLNLLRGLRRFPDVVLLSLTFWAITAVSGSVMLWGWLKDDTLVLGMTMAFAGGVGRTLPALPGSIGTLDAAVLLGLTALGVDEPSALAIVLLLRIRYILVTIVTGALGFIMENYP